MVGMFGVCSKDYDDELPITQPAPQKVKVELGEARIWLMIFETCPAQLLNAYGMSEVATLLDDQVWAALSQPLATGAMYGTELASQVIISSS